MLCLRPLCGIIVGPLAMTAASAAVLGTLTGWALGACARAEPPGREPERAEGRAGNAGAPEPGPRRRRRGRAL